MKRLTARRIWPSQPSVVQEGAVTVEFTERTKTSARLLHTGQTNS